MITSDTDFVTYYEKTMYIVFNYFERMYDMYMDDIYTNYKSKITTFYIKYKNETYAIFYTPFTEKKYWFGKINQYDVIEEDENRYDNPTEVMERFIEAYID